MSSFESPNTELQSSYAPLISPNRLKWKLHQISRLLVSARAKIHQFLFAIKRFLLTFIQRAWVASLCIVCRFVWFCCVMCLSGLVKVHMLGCWSGLWWRICTPECALFSAYFDKLTSFLETHIVRLISLNHRIALFWLAVQELKHTKTVQKGRSLLDLSTLPQTDFAQPLNQSIWSAEIVPVRHLKNS